MNAPLRGVCLHAELLTAIHLPDWGAAVDCNLIDAAHDDSVFNVPHADVPERTQDIVAGSYELATPPVGPVAAMKVIDMMDEERIVSISV